MKKCLSLLLLCLAYNCSAMEMKMEMEFVNKVKEGSIVTLLGKATNKRGELLCMVSHNEPNGAYYGSVENKGYYAKQNWKLHMLKQQDAEKYFKEIAAALNKQESTTSKWTKKKAIK